MVPEGRCGREDSWRLAAGLASRSGSVQAPLAQSVGHVAPGSAQDSPSAQDAAQAGPQHHSLQHDSQV